MQKVHTHGVNIRYISEVYIQLSKIDNILNKANAYLCLRTLAHIFKFGCKDSKKFSYTQVFRRKSLGKVDFEGKKAFLAAFNKTDRGHVITRPRDHETIMSLRPREKKIPPRVNAGHERRYFRASRVSARGDFCHFGGKNCSQHGEKPKKRKFMNDFCVFSCTIRKKVVTLRGF